MRVRERVVRLAAGQGDLDPEPAFGAGVQLERAVVRRGDRGDDRESEPVPVLRAGAIGAEATEWFGKLRDCVPGQGLARRSRRSAARARRDAGVRR